MKRASGKSRVRSDDGRRQRDVPRILVVLDHYLPGYQSGGPVRTIANVVDHLGEEYQFSIFTRDRDFLQTSAYPNVQSDTWTQVGPARVYYTSPANLSLATLRQVIADVQPALLYLNSLFSGLTQRVLVWRALRLIPEIPIVLAPRGELAPAALAVKRVKKFLYLTLIPRRLYHGILWQASSEGERQEILSAFGPQTRVQIAPNLAPVPRASAPSGVVTKLKRPGVMRLVFLSRIVPMKNLHFALQLVSTLRGEIQFDVYGPCEDPAYWQKCAPLFGRMPPNVRASYKGPVAHEHVLALLSQYDFLLLPTLGESFGHVVLESFSAGIPVMISDRTPWRELAEREVGWDLSLDGPDAWRAALQACVDMDEAEYQRLARRSREFAHTTAGSPVTRHLTIELFQRALADPGPS